MKARIRQPLAHLIALSMLALANGPATMTAQIDPLSPTSLPLAEWIEAGEHKDFDWEIDIENPTLRMTQHFEVAVKARVEAGDLDEALEDHILSLFTIVTDRDGEWLGVSEPVRETLPAEVHEDTGVELETYVSLIPGRYVVWAILYDEATGQRNIARERREVDAIGGDPLPEAYADFPTVEFAAVEHTAGLTVREFGSDLSIPIPNLRPIDLELVTTISAPEQWPGGTAVSRHIENLSSGLRALYQMDPARGSISITGLDLLRRSKVYEQNSETRVDWTALLDTFDRVNRSAVSVEALLGREDNAAFLREYVEERTSGHMLSPNQTPDQASPLKVLIIVAGVMRFDDDADKSAIELEGECDCRIYHVRFKQNRTDLFDQIDDLLEQFDPPTFDVVSARDFRRVIGEIVEDLSPAGR